MKDLPARRPQMSQASVAGCVGGVLRPVHSLKMSCCSAVMGRANNAATKARHGAQVVGSLNLGAKRFLSAIASRSVMGRSVRLARPHERLADKAARQTVGRQNAGARAFWTARFA